MEPYKYCYFCIGRIVLDYNLCRTSLLPMSLRSVNNKRCIHLSDEQMNSMHPNCSLQNDPMKGKTNNRYLGKFCFCFLNYIKIQYLASNFKELLNFQKLDLFDFNNTNTNSCPQKLFISSVLGNKVLLAMYYNIISSN